jgi:hypothetical protein
MQKNFDKIDLIDIMINEFSRSKSLDFFGDNLMDNDRFF